MAVGAGPDIDRLTDGGADLPPSLKLRRTAVALAEAVRSARSRPASRPAAPSVNSATRSYSGTRAGARTVTPFRFDETASLSPGFAPAGSA